jgi:hypothetical protein
MTLDGDLTTTQLDYSSPPDIKYIKIKVDSNKQTGINVTTSRCYGTE